MTKVRKIQIHCVALTLFAIKTFLLMIITANAFFFHVMAQNLIKIIIPSEKLNGTAAFGTCCPCSLDIFQTNCWKTIHIINYLVNSKIQTLIFISKHWQLSEIENKSDFRRKSDIGGKSEIGKNLILKKKSEIGRKSDMEGNLK